MKGKPKTMAKKKNSRKALAVALGIMGVAGLSVASASQLTVNVNDDNIAVGTNTFDAACDDAVNVNYTYDLATGKYTDLVISGVAAGCENKTLEYTLEDDAATPATITTGTLTVGASGTETVSINTVDLTTGLGSIDIAIY
jgi:hypothetical protein